MSDEHQQLSIDPWDIDLLVAEEMKRLHSPPEGTCAFSVTLPGDAYPLAGETFKFFGSQWKLGTIDSLFAGYATSMEDPQRDPHNDTTALVYCSGTEERKSMIVLMSAFGLDRPYERGFLEYGRIPINRSRHEDPISAHVRPLISRRKRLIGGFKYIHTGENTRAYVKFQDPVEAGVTLRAIVTGYSANVVKHRSSLPTVRF